MLLNKTITAMIVAAAASGIAIGSATTYVIVNQSGNCYATQNAADDEYLARAREISKKPVDVYDDEGGRRITTNYRIKKPHE